jgi:bacterioferritin (cytochrome b1)
MLRAAYGRRIRLSPRAARWRDGVEHIGYLETQLGLASTLGEQPYPAQLVE